MCRNRGEKTATKADVKWPTRPNDAKSTESQYSYYARKYMEAQSARYTPKRAISA